LFRPTSLIRLALAVLWLALPAAAVTFSPSSISVSEFGQSVKISWTGGNGYYTSFNTSLSWVQVTSNTSTPTAGNIDIYINSNNSSQRSGTIQICLGSCFSLSVTQAAHFVFSVTVSPTSLTPPAAGATGTLTTTTNGSNSYYVDIYDDWIHVSPDSGISGNATLTYTIDANTTGSTRSTEFYVYDQTVTVTQSGAAVTGSLTLNPLSATVAATGGTGTVAATSNLTTYAWTAVSNNPWITVTSGASTTGSGSVGYSVPAITTVASRTGTITIGDKTFSITQTGRTGSLTLSPTSLSPPASGQSSTISVTSNATDFAWTAVSNQSWLTVTSGASTTGNGSVGFSVASNPSVSSRSGAITIGDKSFAVTQAGLTGSVTLNPTSLSAVAAGQSGSVAVTANASDYAWTAVSNDAWITVTSGASTTGNGSVGYSVAANSSTLPRSGSITIGDKTFNVSQDGVAGSITLNPTSLSASATGQTGTVAVTANVGDYAWTAVSNNPWITVTSGANSTGNATVGYTIAAATTVASRSGSITIGDKTFSVTQAGVTGGITLNPTSLSAAGAGQSGTVAVTSNATDFSWTAASNSPWITITSGANSTGSGSVGYTVAPATSVVSRNGSITIGDQTFSVTQSGLTGSVTLSPTSLNAAGAGQSGTVAATANAADYAWTAVSNNAWITVTSGASTTGSGSVGYTVAPATTVASRNGSITIGDKTFSITQAGLTGSVTLSSSSLSAASAGESQTVTVTANAADFGWTAVSNNPWITVTSGANVTGNGSVGFTVAAATTVASRSGSITIGDKTFSVTQAGLTGGVSLNPSTLNAAAAGQSGTVTVTSNASDFAWTAVSNNPWITVTSGASTTGSGSVGYTVAAATTVASRSGSITIGDKTFSVTQAGISGSVTLSPTSLSAVAAGESQSIAVTANAPDFAWTAVSNNAWITVTSGASTTGSGSVAYTVAPATTIASRSGSITIGDKTFSVTQAGLTGSVSLSSSSLSPGAAGQSGTVGVLANAPDFAWTAVSHNAWITVTSGANSTGNGSVGFTVAAATTVAPRSGSITIGDKTFSITQAGLTGSVSLNPASVNAATAGQSGTIAASANAPDYAWTAVSNHPWITVTSGANTTGSGSVGFTVAAATTVATRNGTITIGDQLFSVTQTGMTGSLTLGSSSFNAAAAGESHSVVVTSNAPDFNWTAVSNNPWITITSGASSTGSGSVSFTVAPATTIATRGGSITIGDRTFTVTQAGLTGSLTLSPASLNPVAAGQSGSVAITSNAPDFTWTAVSNNPWITVTSGANTTGSGSVGYTVAPATTVAPRSGSITIGDKTFAVTQAGMVGSVTLTPPTLNAAATAQNGTVTVASNAPDYAWTAVSNNPWITVTSGASTTGNGSVGYSVAPATTVATRTGSITIGDKTFSITQAGLVGSLTLAPASLNAVAAGESQTITVTSNAPDYAWTAVSNRAWITITSGASTTGSGAVGFTIAPATTVAPRSGAITLGDKTFLITQAGLVGSLTLGASTLSPGADGQSGTVTVTSNAPDFAWTAVSNKPWILVTGGASTTGNGLVSYSIAPATTVAPRTGLITIGDKTFSVTQAGLVGTLTLNPASVNAVAAGQSGTVAASANAPDYAWTSVSSQAWITITSGAANTGSGSTGYTVAAATSVASRTGAITMGDKTLTITQAGLEGSLTLSAASLTAPAQGQKGTVTVTANAQDYAWTAVSNHSWITIDSGASGTGNGSVAFTVAPTTTVASRTGTLTIGGKLFTITQTGITGSVTLSPASLEATPASQRANITVTANATDFAWSALSRSAWITIVSGGSGKGDGTVTITVTAASSVASRTGSITIADKTFTVTQSGVSGKLTLEPASAELTATGGSGSVQVRSNAADFTWTASTGQSWITLTSTASLTGDGTVLYQVAPTTSTATRAGAITIGGETFQITQAGGKGSLDLSDNALNVIAAGGRRSITVTANYSDYAWTADSSVPWITIASAASGSGFTGSTSLLLDIAATNSTKPRTGIVIIGGRKLTVVQEGGELKLTLNPASLTIGAAGGQATLSVTANYADGVWSATSETAWLTLSSNQPTTGSGTIVVQAPELKSVQPRTGQLSIGGQMVTVTQSGGKGELALSGEQISVDAAATTRSIGVATNYSDFAWTATSADSWIVVSPGGGTGPGTLSLQIARLDSGGWRTGTVSVAGHTLTVRQTSSVIVSPSYLNLNAPRGGTPAKQTVSVRGTPGTGFEVVRSADSTWLTVDPRQGVTPAVLTVTADPAGLPPGSYQGSVTINGQVLSVSFTVSRPVIALSLSSLFFQKTNEDVDLSSKAIIVSADGGPVTYSAALTDRNVSWLSLTGTEGAAPGAIQVSVSPAGLPTGEYRAVILLSLTGASVESLTIPVTLRIPELSVTVSGAAGSPPVGTQDAGNGQVNLASNTQDPQVPPPGAQLQVNTPTPQPFRASTTMPGGANWLSVSPTSGSTPANLSLVVDRTGLQPGTYSGFVNVSTGEGSAPQGAGLKQPAQASASPLAATEASSKSVTLAVTFTVDAPVKTVGVTPSSLSLSRQKDSTAVQRLTLQVSGAPGQQFYAASNAPWIRLSPASGTAPAAVQVDIDPSYILTEKVLSTITFTSPDAPATPTLVPIEVQSLATPLALTLDQTWLELTGQESAEPASLSIRLNSSTTGTPFSVASSQPWLSAVSDGGTAPATVNVLANPDGLKPGAYSGNLVFTAGASQVMLHVSFTVNPRPSFQVSASPVGLRLIQHSASGTESTLSLTARVRNIPFTSTVQDGSWLTVTSDSSTTPAALRVSTTAEALELAAGVYTATITVNSTEGSDPVEIPVVLTVDAGAPALGQPEIVSFASGQIGPIAPGMLIKLTGLHLPVEPLEAKLDTRVAPQQLAGVRVLFDGLPGPVLSVAPEEVSAMVPYELGSRTATAVTLEYLGQAAPPVLATVTAWRPEVVPVAESPGSLARHPDGTPVSAQAPALPDSIIQIDATGLGLTDPLLSSTAVQTQSLPVGFGGNLSVLYNGTPAVVLFTGPKPGRAPGLIQINIRVPADAAPNGDITVSLTGK
jgi:hypothetical protein